MEPLYDRFYNKLKLQILTPAIAIVPANELLIVRLDLNPNAIELVAA